MAIDEGCPVSRVYILQKSKTRFPVDFVVQHPEEVTEEGNPEQEQAVYTRRATRDDALHISTRRA